MRSVKGERKPRKGNREAASRTSARVARIKHSSPQSFGKRAKFRDDPVSRAIRGIRGWFIVRRPLIALSGGLAVFVVIAGLFVGGYVGRTIRGIDKGIDGLEADAGFGIQNVEIAGNSRTPTASLGAALGLSHDQSIFNVDLQAARRRLMALDWVAEADVKRRYPDTIIVHIVEKLPFALWQGPQGLFVVERSGGLITSKNVAQFAKLPKLAGPGGNVGADLVDAIATHRAVAARVSVMERIGQRRWNLILNDGVTVKLPEANWDKQLDVLEHLIVDKGVLERDITEIDLRSPTQFFFMEKNPPKPADDGGKQI